MQWYHYVLVFLKLVFLIEFFLIIYDRNLVHPKVYITSEILFKLLLSIYIQYIIIFVVYKNISAEDKIFISFGAGLLMYDAVFNDLPKLLDMYGIHNTHIVKH
jgi:hypothetical protein